MNILLTSAGRRSYLVTYFKEALQMAGCPGKVHAANSQPSPAFLSADETVITPLIYDAYYIPFLLDYCKKEAIDLLIPLFDIDLPVLAAHREAFQKQGTLVVTADLEAVTICNDKWKSREFLQNLGFAQPKSWLTPKDALEAVHSGEVHFPLMVKPRWGMGSLELFTADNEEELALFFEKCRRQIGHTYLKYEARQDANACVMIQEKLSGKEYGLDVMNDLSGKTYAVSVKKKTAMRSGETDEAVTVDEPELAALGRKLGTALRQRGNLDVDVFLANGKWYVLEMNARFGGGYPFSHAAGVNLPLAIVKWALGQDVQESLLSAKPGVRACKDIQMLVWRE